MTSLSSQPPSILEAYAAHVVLHSCGVSLEDIYITPALAPDGSGEALGVMARHGGIEFIVTVGPFGMEKAAFWKLWKEALLVINKTSAVDREKAISGTWVRANAVQIIAAFTMKKLAAKGTS